jgi:hypothetical protein
MFALPPSLVMIQEDESFLVGSRTPERLNKYDNKDHVFSIFPE